MVRDKILGRNIILAAICFGFLIMASSAKAAEIRVTIENLAPANGNYLTPVWVGFHNGGFDIYDTDTPAAGFLERLAEDGNTAPISNAFTVIGSGTAQGTIPGPGGAIAPGETAAMDFTLDGSLASSRYFSYASMVIPSNDAFIANENPIAFRIFDDWGNFLGANFFVSGAMVFDAGTEVNDELPANTAFFGQATPNTGVDENGMVHLHPGFLPPGSGGILDSSMFANADFARDGYPVAQIRIDAVPVPGALWLLGSGLVGLVGFGRKLRS